VGRCPLITSDLIFLEAMFRQIKCIAQGICRAKLRISASRSHGWLLDTFGNQFFRERLNIIDEKAKMVQSTATSPWVVAGNMARFI